LRARRLTDLIDEAGKSGAQAGQALQLAEQDLARLSRRLVARRWPS
jgi:hypothetical protein